MKRVTTENVVSLANNLFGIAVIVFGISQETANIVNQALPIIAGGIVSAVSLASYVYNRRKARETAFNAMIASMNTGIIKTSGRDPTVRRIAEDCGLL